MGAPALAGPNTAVWPEHRPWGSPATLACFDPHLHRSAKTLTSVLLTFLVCRMGSRRSSPAEAPAASGVRLCSYGEGRLVASAPELRALVPSQTAVCPVGNRVRAPGAGSRPGGHVPLLPHRPGNAQYF